MPQPFSAETIAAALRARRLKASLHFFAQLPSTSDVAKRLLSEGAPEWTIVVADEQTAGRGRMGRRWVAPAGTALLLSVVLRPRIAPHRLSRLTMMGALATMRALRRWFAKAELGLKWPNDVLLRRRKVAGVLPEGVFEGKTFAGAVLGIGLNVNTDFSGDSELSQTAISMAEAQHGRPFDRVEVLAELLLRLEQEYPRLESRLLFQEWREALVMIGQRVTVTTPQGALQGLAEAVDPDGALWLRADDERRHRLLAGDVSLAGGASPGRER